MLPFSAEVSLLLALLTGIDRPRTSLVGSICKPSRSNIVHKIEQYIQYCAIKFCHFGTFYHKILHIFLHNKIIKKDCTKVFIIYSTTLHKVLHGIIAAFIAKYCTDAFFKFSTDTLFKFNLQILLLLHFDSRRSSERDQYRIA